MVLAGPAASAPTPTSMVRVLVTRRGELLTVPRADGRGLDIPSRRVGHGDAVEACVQRLLRSALGSVPPAVLVGYVRNVVDQPTGDYPWPTPVAHFGVWHCELPAHCEVGGRWLDAGEATSLVAERHWWPIAAHVMSRGG